MFWGLVLVVPGLCPDAPQLFEFVPIVQDFDCAAAEKKAMSWLKPRLTSARSA